MRKSSWVRSEMICLCLSRTVAYKLTSETPTRMGCWGSCVPAGGLACGPCGQASPEENGGGKRLPPPTVYKKNEPSARRRNLLMPPFPLFLHGTPPWEGKHSPQGGLDRSKNKNGKK